MSPDNSEDFSSEKITSENDDGTLMCALDHQINRELHDEIAHNWIYNKKSDVDPRSDDFDMLIQEAMEDNHAPIIRRTSVADMFPLWNGYNVAVFDCKFGKGVFATEYIPKGHIFLAEVGISGNRDSLRMEAALLSVGEFTLAHQQLPPKYPDSWCPFPQFSLDQWNIVRSSVAENAFAVNSKRRVLFHMTSRINHSCNPNAFRRHCKNQIEIFATRDIQRGSEIFIQYSANAGHEDTSHFVCDCKNSPSTKTK